MEALNIKNMNAVMPKTAVDHSVAALVSGPLVIRETIYGIVKRLDFFVRNIEGYRQKEGLEPYEVRILDVGCGTGVNVAIPLAHAGYFVLGIDSDFPSIDRGQQLARNLKNIEFLCGSLESHHFAQRFHVVICSEVLEHLEEPALLIQQIKAALHERGLLLVTVPNGFGYFELDSFFWRIFSSYPRLIEKIYQLENIFWRRFGSTAILQRREEEYRSERLKLTWSTLAPDTAHFQSFTPWKISRLLSSEGFRVLEVRNNTFLAGNLLGLLVRELDSFLSWNCRIADKLPSALVSGWLIATRRLIH